ncbi:galactose-specific lectin nattectin-like [Colossoma macropomum]|uniref:galactose-specific lectin nattectin-like n=1 Tax=Colossoma macropomum TaxID=42526 RepID=UPI0018650905|nr:galactose-specific lectin nattectin-like [Colossoma macropomum]
MAFRYSLLLSVMCLLAVHQAVADEKKQAVLRNSGWKSHGSHEFKFFGFKSTWEEAEKTCLRNDAHLASVHDENEDNFIKRLIHAHSNKNIATWLGGYRSKTARDRWYWTDGSHFDFAEWAPGEPNGSGQCLQTNYYGAWDDLVCYYKRPFVCARKAKTGAFKSLI